MKAGADGGDAMVGVGLRSAHFSRLLARPRTPVRWFEAISENYMDSQGRPLEVLKAIRADYPVALHGVSLSIGGVEGPRPGYLERLKRLIAEIDPLVVSDHLCFTGAHASSVHDLLPLPYTEEAIRTVVANVSRVQDFLGRPIALENVSSYLTHKSSEMKEEEFLVAIARRAGCRILLDVNNVYVSAMNHGFKAEEYLDAIPNEFIAQLHLGGYSDMGTFLFDTHSRAPTDPVWELYRRVIRRVPRVPVLIEWDEAIPDWSGLEAEAVKAIRIAREAHAVAS
ncbi:MAG: hypothetical protein COV48_10055 [Elusimicrobia bacterium CG11_big_fil_rev_8_21_14_0_20_64_6]|nr:MAG: hypothetical protein COV48_10055 [Elusimicrobia bacterium CG11_big_fil_rev_8_21_14_0_20_64_6]